MDLVAEATKLFADENATELELATLCQDLYDQVPSKVFPFLEAFAKRFPFSIFRAPIDLASFYAISEQYDPASYVAHLYLYSALNFLKTQYGKPETPEALATIVFSTLPHAFSLATAVYTLVGARSYSLRILDVAKSLRVSKPGGDVVHLNLGQSLVLIQEEDHIREELEDPINQAVDKEFEAFFATGTGAAPLFAYAGIVEANILKIRLEALARLVKEKLPARLDGSEIFLPISMGSDGNYRIG